MRWALRGIAVTVLKPMRSSADPFGAPAAGTPAPMTVDNVMVDSPTVEELDLSTRQFGVRCDLKLHFPKACHDSLRGCSVVLPAPWSGTFEVIGDPMPYDPELTPGEHDREVLVRRVEG